MSLVDVSRPPELSGAKITRLSAMFAGGNVISLALRMIGGILLARATDPATLGLFNSLALVLGYLPFLQLGVLNGLNRELPYHLGGGRRQTALVLASAAQSWSLAVGTLSTIVLGAVAAFYAWHRQWYLAIGWLTNAFGAFAYFYTTYLQTTLRTSGDFARLAIINMAQNTVALGSIVAVAIWGYFGLCLRTVLSTGAQLILLRYWAPLRVKPSWCWASVLQLMKTGLPIFAVGQLYAWWTVLDATLVLRYVGIRAVGLYALATLTTSAMSVLSLSVSQVVYPKMADELGRGCDPAKLLRTAIVPTMGLTALTALAALFGWYAMPHLVLSLVPKYHDGIAAAQWSVIATSVMALSPPLAIYNVVRRQDLYTIALVSGMSFYGIFVFWFSRSGWHLSVFPQAMLVGNAVFVGVSYILFCPLVHRLRQAGLGADSVASRQKNAQS